MNLFVGKRMADFHVAGVASLPNAELAQLSTEDFAWLVHEAETHNDDVSMGRFSEFLANRPEFAETYRTIWKQHAQVRGYDK